MSNQRDAAEAVAIVAKLAPILKDAFPDVHSITRFQVAHALADAIKCDKGGEMTREEHHLEYLKQMSAYTGPTVSFEVREPYYLASCDACGWVGSSELCGTDSWGDDSDVYCPRCQASGADCGKVADRIPAPSDQEKLIAELEAMTRNRDNLRTYLAQRTQERNDARDDRDMWRKHAQTVGAKAEAMVRAAMEPAPITRARQTGERS